MQELAFALANAIGLLDLLKERGRFTDDEFERAVGRISLFVNAGIRFIEEMCKMRAFSELWDEITRERYGVKNAVSHLVSLFEDQRDIGLRAEVLQQFQVRPARKSAVMIGFTGTPGSGKSSLLSRLTLDLLGSSTLSVAVLAIDPSSHVSGGALLGDRTRMRLPPDERRLFFRSQASATELGGLGPWSFQVCRLLSYCFDCVLVETVGIGQSDADIRHLADRVYLVLQPLAGDEIQFLKAGIMEIPHAFILNKCDEPSAARSYHQLKGSVGLARPWDSDSVPIYKTSARTGEGLAELCTGVIKDVHAHTGAALSAKEPYFFERWVRDEWGRFGVRVLDAALGGARAYLEASRGFETAQAAFAAHLRDELASGRHSFDRRR